MRASTVTVKGQITDPVADEEARRELRERLRRSMSQRRDTQHVDEVHQPALSVSEKVADVECALEGASLPLTSPSILELTFSHKESPPPRQYFVLTDAGKPVFVSETSPMAKDPEALASTIGLVQALISVFIDDGDKLRYVNAGRTRISFLLRTPLYYACVSSWGEPESVVRFFTYLFSCVIPTGKVADVVFVCSPAQEDSIAS